MDSPDPMPGKIRPRRAGGRAARHTLRTNPLAEDKRPVAPALTAGNTGR